MNRGSLPLDERIDLPRLAEHLADALRRVHGENVTVAGDRVSFAAGIFRPVSNWNVLVPFSHGELIIDRVARQLEYRVSFGQIAFVLVVFSVAAVAAMLKSHVSMVLIVLAVAIIWLWFGGMNVLIGRARLERFLRRTIDAAARRDLT